MTPMRLLGIGTAAPPFAVAQSAAAAVAGSLGPKAVEQSKLISELYRRSCVSFRHSVVLDGDSRESAADQRFFIPTDSADGRGPSTKTRMTKYEQEATLLACRASTAALEDAGVDADRLTHLVTVSCTGFSAPGFEFGLVRDMRLSPAVAKTHLGFMGCHGALNGLRVAHAFTAGDPDAVALVCAVELCSLHHHYAPDASGIVANALFGDGAAAIVCAAAAGERTTPGWTLARNGSRVIPDSSETMTWRIGDYGFEMFLAIQVPELIRAHLRPWVEEWLSESGLGIGDVRQWVVHPGGPRILRAAAQALGLSDDDLADSWKTLANYGNMSSPTVVFILDAIRKRGENPSPCVVLGFGPGLVVEAALLR